MKSKEFLGTEPVDKILLNLSLPAFVGMFIFIFSSIIDTIFIGRSIGSVGIAAISIVFPVQIIMMAVGLMIGMGGASIVSRSLGEGDMKRAERTYGNVVTMTVVAGLAITIISLLNINYLVKLFGATDTIFPYARDYMEITLLGGTFAVFAMESNNVIRAEGNAIFAMKVIIVGAVINLILDPVLIFLLHMGIKGAAWSAVISRVIMALYVMYYFLGGQSLIKFKTISLIPDINIIKEMLSIGISSFITSAASSFTVIILNRLAGLYGGDISVAIFGIINRMLRFSFMPVIAIGQGLQPLLGYNYGAKKMDRAKKAIILSLYYSLIISVIMFILIFTGPEWIIKIFSSEEDLVLQGKGPVRTVVIAMVLATFQFIGSTVFQSTGKVIPAFFLSISREILFFLPLLFLLSHIWKLEGIWFTFPIADVLSCIVALSFLIPSMKNLNKSEEGIVYG